MPFRSGKNLAIPTYVTHTYTLTQAAMQYSRYCKTWEAVDWPPYGAPPNALGTVDSIISPFIPQKMFCVKMRGRRACLYDRKATLIWSLAHTFVVFKWHSASAALSTSTL